MNREVHVRIWERPEVRALRATRHKRLSSNRLQIREVRFELAPVPLRPTD